MGPEILIHEILSPRFRICCLKTTELKKGKGARFPAGDNSEARFF